MTSRIRPNSPIAKLANVFEAKAKEASKELSELAQKQKELMDQKKKLRDVKDKMENAKGAEENKSVMGVQAKVSRSNIEKNLSVAKPAYKGHSKK